MKDRQHLLRLRTKGFKPLRPGKIHVRCPACGRKLSNASRGHMDPPKAFLIEVFCDCTQGGKEDFGGYYDSRGRTLCSYCGRLRCERAAGNWRCTEALLNQPPDPASEGPSEDA